MKSLSQQQWSSRSDNNHQLACTRASNYKTTCTNPHTHILRLHIHKHIEQVAHTHRTRGKHTSPRQVTTTATPRCLHINTKTHPSLHTNVSLPNYLPLHQEADRYPYINQVSHTHTPARIHTPTQGCMRRYKLHPHTLMCTHTKHTQATSTHNLQIQIPSRTHYIHQVHTHTDTHTRLHSQMRVAHTYTSNRIHRCKLHTHTYTPMCVHRCRLHKHTLIDQCAYTGVNCTDTLIHQIANAGVSCTPTPTLLHQRPYTHFTKLHPQVP